MYFYNVIVLNETVYMICNNTKVKLLSLLMGFIMLLKTIIIDFWINNYLLKLCIPKTYIDLIFSLIFTVSTLSCTLLSIIVSASNNTVLGLKIKEIVSLSHSPLNLKTMIVVMLVSILFSIPLLAFHLIISQTLLAVFVVAYIIKKTCELCRIVFDESYTKQIIYSSLQATKSIKANYVNNWLIGLNVAIENNDIEQEESLLSLINKAVSINRDSFINKTPPKKESYSYHDQIKQQLLPLFSKSCTYQSFINSYKRILRLNDAKNIYFHETPIVLNYIDSYKYASPKDINNFNFPAKIDEIIECDFLDDELRRKIVCRFFNAFICNINISESDKLKLLDTCFYTSISGLLNFEYKHNDPARIDIFLHLFKNQILLADDFNFGKKYI